VRGPESIDHPEQVPGQPRPDLGGDGLGRTSVKGLGDALRDGVGGGRAEDGVVSVLPPPQISSNRFISTFFRARSGAKIRPFMAM
jgi:hypothetical protein